MWVSAMWAGSETPHPSLLLPSKNKKVFFFFLCSINDDHVRLSSHGQVLASSLSLTGLAGGFGFSLALALALQIAICNWHALTMTLTLPTYMLVSLLPLLCCGPSVSFYFAFIEPCDGEGFPFPSYTQHIPCVMGNSSFHSNSPTLNFYLFF